MKTNLATGAILLLPLVLTIIILTKVINLLTHPFLELTETWLMHFGFFHHTIGFDKNHMFLIVISKALILLALVAVIILLGVLGRYLLWDRLFSQFNQALEKIPYINKIYQASREVSHSLFSPTSTSFSRAVYLPLFHKVESGASDL